MNVTVIVGFQARRDQVEQLSAFLSSLQAGVIAAGGLSISLLQDQDDPTRFFELERWATADAHKKFVARAAAAGAFAPFDELLAAPFTISYTDTLKHSSA